MNTNCTTKQKAAIGALCAKLGLNKDVKAAMVSSYSGGRCESSKDLYFNEARQMIMHLNDLTPGPSPTGEGRKKMLNKIFYYCHEMGWTKRSSKTGKTVADGQRFDTWAVKYSYLHKKLNKYTCDELPALVSQFENVYKSWLKTI